MNRFENFGFGAAGDTEQDAREAASIRKHMANEAEGLCPNGCAPIIDDSPSERHCPVCGFVGTRVTFGVSRP